MAHLRHRTFVTVLYRSASVSALIANLEIFCGGSSRCGARPGSGVCARWKGRPEAAHLDPLPRPLNIEHKRMLCDFVVESTMLSRSSTSSVKAAEADIEACGVVLSAIVSATVTPLVGNIDRLAHSRQCALRTVESKHRVQSSRYTC